MEQLNLEQLNTLIILRNGKWFIKDHESLCYLVLNGMIDLNHHNLNITEKGNVYLNNQKIYKK